MSPVGAIAVIERPQCLKTALQLELLTVIWMIVEAVGALAAAFLARSVLLLAFGVDSGIELLSACVLFHRLQKESKGDLDLEQTQKLERQTARIAGWLLYLLAVYVTLQAAYSLWQRNTAETSFLGMSIAVVAAVGMPILARVKLRIANQIGSPALRADAIETLTCGYLSWVLLAGLIANAFLHWWWLDSAACFAVVPLLLREAKEAFTGKCCCD
jgi:divalent metal cation (Fe/Co/Zn/Cd) transporter